MMYICLSVCMYVCGLITQKRPNRGCFCDCGVCVCVCVCKLVYIFGSIITLMRSFILYKHHRCQPIKAGSMIFEVEHISCNLLLFKGKSYLKFGFRINFSNFYYFFIYTIVSYMTYV